MLTPASYSPNRLESVIYPHVKLSVLKQIFPKLPNYAFNHLQTDVFYPCIIQLPWTYGCVFFKLGCTQTYYIHESKERLLWGFNCGTAAGAHLTLTLLWHFKGGMILHHNSDKAQQWGTDQETVRICWLNKKKTRTIMKNKTLHGSDSLPLAGISTLMSI